MATSAFFIVLTVDGAALEAILNKYLARYLNVKDWFFIPFSLQNLSKINVWIGKLQDPCYSGQRVGNSEKSHFVLSISH
uniref:Ovule protein n=1 Tax=Strongyloides venezuelensis TaxID=75913 RepID=A0A0K0G577_STRVS